MSIVTEGAPADPGNEPGPHQPLDHHGGRRPRGQDAVPRSSSTLGRFGRLFRELTPLGLTDDQLRAVAEQMHEATASPGWNGTPQPGDNPRLPAGYTYLAQFVDHDITFDPVSVLTAANDPDALENFRTPRFDLDCLYGGGPKASPYLYDANDPDLLLVGTNPTTGEFEPRDLPRNEQGRALLGDPRNDVQVIISQLHLALIDVHNAVVRRVRSNPALAEVVGGALATGGSAASYGGPTPPLGTLTVFDVASTLVRWHYQWVVLEELLPAIVGDVTKAAVLPEPKKKGGLRKPELKLYAPRRGSFMPVEFSVAAYRFGHSLVRDGYVLNATLSALPVFSPADGPSPKEDLRGFRRLPAGMTIDWARFFPGLGSDPSVLQQARALDTHLSASMMRPATSVDAERRSLALLNLKRGQAVGLPSGEDVATAVQAKVDLSEQRLLQPGETGLTHPAPLWFWVLKEAEVTTGGQHLGPVGGRIVAEVLVGLAARDRSSYLRSKPDFTPVLGAATGEFRAADLLRLAAEGRG